MGTYRGGTGGLGDLIIGPASPLAVNWAELCQHLLLLPGEIRECLSFFIYQMGIIYQLLLFSDIIKRKKSV